MGTSISRFRIAACEVCAKTSGMCAAACEKHADMPEIKACAES